MLDVHTTTQSHNVALFCTTSLYFELFAFSRVVVAIAILPSHVEAEELRAPIVDMLHDFLQAFANNLPPST